MACEAKGTIFLSVKRLVEAQDGPEAMQALVASLDGEFGERFRSGSLLAAAWYPAAWNAHLVLKAQQTLRKDDAWLEQLGRQLLVQDLRGIYRLLVKVVTPQMLLTWVPRMFAQYYRGGQVAVVQSEPQFTVVKYSGCEGFNAPLWMAIRGGSCGALDACGALDVRAETLGGGHQDEALFGFHWRPSDG